MDGIEVRDVTRADWPLIEQLFGPRGACGGCWCMWPRVPRPAFEAGKGEPNRRALAARLRAGEVHAVMAFAGDTPVGWCSFGPRAGFVRLDNARSLARDRGPGTWAVVCFYVPTKWRSRGVARALLGAATARAFALGATEIEGYPVNLARGRLPGPFAWMGVPSLFEAADYVRLRRPAKLRPLYLKTR